MLTPVVSLPVPAVVGIARSGLSGTGHRQSLADRRVDVVEEVVRRKGGVEVHGLGRIDGGAATDGDEGVVLALAGEADGILERGIGWLHANAVVESPRQPARVERVNHRLHRWERADDRVRHHQHLADAELGQVGADLARDAGAKADGGRGHLERVVVLGMHARILADSSYLLLPAS